MRQDATKNIIKQCGRYYLCKMYNGVRHKVDLCTQNKRQAEVQARIEWATILEQERGGEGIVKKRTAKKIPTYKEIETAYLAAGTGPLPASRKSNLRELRKIGREVLGITDKEVETKSIDEIIGRDTLSKWIKMRKDIPPPLSKVELADRKPHEMSSPGNLTPLDQNRVLTTIEGYVKHARGVFAEATMDKNYGCHRDFQITHLEAFMTYPLPKYEARVYSPPSKEEIQCVLDGLPKLEQESPAVYIAIMLGIGCGLRRGEIMHARWDMIKWVDPEDGTTDKIPVLHLGATHQWRGTKGKKERRGEIPSSVYQKLIEHKDNDEFLVPNKRGKNATLRRAKKQARFKGRTKNRGLIPVAKNETTPTSYRTSTSGTYGVACDCGKWLVSVGWKRSQKLHEMRKYFGAIVVTSTGNMFAAKELLGHADIRTTQASYTGLIERVKHSGSVDAVLKQSPRKEIEARNRKARKRAA